MLRYTHPTPFSDQSTYLTASLNFLLQAGDKVLLFSTDGASERMVMCGQVINIYLNGFCRHSKFLPEFRLLEFMQLLTSARAQMSAMHLLFRDSSLPGGLWSTQNTTLAGWVLEIHCLLLR